MQRRYSAQCVSPTLINSLPPVSALNPLSHPSCKRPRRCAALSFFSPIFTQKTHPWKAIHPVPDVCHRGFSRSLTHSSSIRVVIAPLCSLSQSEPVDYQVYPIYNTHFLMGFVHPDEEERCGGRSGTISFIHGDDPTHSNAHITATPTIATASLPAPPF